MMMSPDAELLAAIEEAHRRADAENRTMVVVCRLATLKGHSDKPTYEVKTLEEADMLTLIVIEPMRLGMPGDGQGRR